MRSKATRIGRAPHATAQSFADAARKLVGAPFEHQGRSVVLGMDCAGVVVVAAREVGYPVQDYTHYPPAPTASVLEQRLRASFDLALLSDLRVGDVAVIRIGSAPRHVSVAVAGGIVHSDNGLGVVFRREGSWMDKCIDSVWRLRT